MSVLVTFRFILHITFDRIRRLNGHFGGKELSHDLFVLLRSFEKDRGRIYTRFEIMWLIEHAVMAARLLT